MIGFRLVEPGSDLWAVVHLSAKQPGAWQVTFGNKRGPIGDTCRDSPHECLEIAMVEGCVLAEARGDGASAIAAAVQDHRAAVQTWIDADDWTIDPPRRTW